MAGNARRRFDVLLVDFYGTIADGDRAAVEAACTAIVETCELPLSPADFAVIWGERFFEVVAESNHEAFRTLCQCELVSLRETLRRLDRDVDPQPFVQELEEYWRNPPVHSDALDFLSKVNLPVCCVSNADTDALKAAIARHGLRFDAVITSESVRSYKPDEVIFRSALARMDVQAHRTIHVGDSLHSDVGGANKLGISTALICRDGRIHDIGDASPSWTVRSLVDVCNLL